MDLEKTLSRAAQDLRRLLGDNLVSLVVYGSAAAGDFEPGVSDVNLALVLRRVELADLEAVRRVQHGLRRWRVATPLVMTPEHIRDSADVFPIEFLEIQEKHRVLHGEDLFAGLAIDTRHLRHECEHELKGRLIRIRQSLLELGPRPQALAAMLLSAHQANFPAFRTALRLRGQTPPLKKEEVAGALAKAFQLDPELFVRLKLLRRGELKLSLDGLRQLIQTYWNEVDKVARVVDRL